MKKYIGIAMLVLFVFTAFSMANTADATCSKEGYIIRVSTNPGSSVSYIYFRTSGLSNVYFYGTTSDSKLIDAALNALTSRAYVLIYGNIASCPSSGSVGTVTYLAVSP